jgi:hypothetical protein
VLPRLGSQDFEGFGRLSASRVRARLTKKRSLARSVDRKKIANQAVPSSSEKIKRRETGNSKQGRKKEGEGREAGRRILKKGNLHRTRDTPWGSETRVQNKKKKKCQERKSTSMESVPTKSFSPVIQ